MSIIDRIKSWFSSPSADPEDLHGTPPDSPGATTGLDRPLRETGPVADPGPVDPDLGPDDGALR